MHCGIGRRVGILLRLLCQSSFHRIVANVTANFRVLVRIPDSVIIVSGLPHCFHVESSHTQCVRKPAFKQLNDLSERLPIRRTGDELEQLAETCNDMLSRLETAVARIKRFTADASHELRSPLSYIRIVAEDALRHPDLPPEYCESFDGILAEAKEATALLEDMLLLARADAGHVDIPFERIDFVDLVAGAIARARVVAEAKGHHLSLQCPGGPCEIRGDRPGLQRLVWALLDNAIKYTPAGGHVDVSLDRNAAQARLEVRDDGIGIPAGLLPRVFDRFFRADPSRSQEGTGLGLAIAKWIADVHQADLSVESEVNVGSTFTVVFPIEPEDSLQS